MKRFSSMILFGAFALSSSVYSAIDPLVDAADRQDGTAPALIASQKSTESALRVRAGEALGRILKPESVDPLLNLLKDSDPRVVRQALFSLGQLGWKAEFNGSREKEIVEQIKPFLSNSSEKTRAEAVHAIGKLGYDETPALVEKSLTDASEAVREEALIALFRYRYAMSMRGQKFTPWSDEFSAKVLSLETDSSLDVRRALAFIYSRHTDARGSLVLTRLLKDRDSTVRVHVINSLKRIADPSALPFFFDALSDSSKEVRFAGMEALEALEAMKAHERFTESHLKSLVKDSYFAVRKKAAELLGKSTEVANRALYRKTLISFQKDSSPTVAGAAFTSLIALLRSGTPTPEETRLMEVELDYLMKSKDWHYRLAGMQAYVAILNGASENPSALEKKALDVVTEGSKTEKHQLVRMTALSKMVELKGPAGLDAVQRALSSDLFSEKAAALDALISRPESETDKIAILMAYYRSSMDPKLEEPRGYTVEVLREFKSDASTEALKSILLDPSPAIVAAATKELKARGVNVSEAPPVPLTFSPYREMTFARNPILVFHTLRGNIVMEGLAFQAPIHVANFVGLAKAGFYEGKAFQRIVSNFVVQGGAADLNGASTDLYSLRAEMNRVRYERGAVGMPRAATFDSGGTQIFINQITSPWLDGLYTVFARVISGMDVVDRMEPADPILKVDVQL